MVSHEPPQDHQTVLVDNRGFLSCCGCGTYLGGLRLGMPRTVMSRILDDAATALAVSRMATPLQLRGGQPSNMHEVVRQCLLGAAVREGAGHAVAELRRTHDGLRIAHETITNQLPSFSEISFEEILDLREEQQGALQAFRGEMLRCATQIRCLPQDADYEQAIVDISRGTVEPALQEFRESLRATRLTFAQKLIDDAFSMTGLATFIGSVYVGLPLQGALLLSAAAVGAKAAAQTFLEQKKTTDAHGLRLLLRIQKKRGRGHSI